MAEPAVKARVEGKVSSRWLTLKLLDSDPSLMKELREYLNEDILEVPEISLALSQAREHLAKYGITNEILKDRILCGSYSYEHPLSLSYGVNLPSSLITLLPLALESSSCPPVSVCGTGT